MPTTIRRTIAVTSAVLAAGLMLSACSAADAAPDAKPSSKATPEASAKEPVPGAEASEGSEDGPVDFEAALAERDQFIADQGMPLDGTPLVAHTDAQKEFIGREKAFVESQGQMWSAEAESTYLALAMDACETSILQGHRVTQDTLVVHVASSPLFQAMLPAEITGEERRVGERNTSAKMITGVSYLCEADTAHWVEAFNAVYPPSAPGEAPLGG